MSIASEIQDLNTILTAAKNAVTAKGGTVGDTGLAGLANEITTIPSGGTLSSYGSLQYLDTNNVLQTVELATEDDFFEICENTSSSANYTINGVTVPKNKVKKITIADGVTFIPDYFASNCSALTEIVLPSTITYIGSNVCYNTAVDCTIDLSNVKSIGISFLSNSPFNHAINLPKIEYIGNNFLSSCATFNSTITINDGCRIIGESFMINCTSFAGSLTVPSSLERFGSEPNPGKNFMRECKNFTGPLVCNGPTISSMSPNDTNSLTTTDSNAVMYTTGITLSGTYAQNWKNRLADRSTSPYRKLIIGS